MGGRKRLPLSRILQITTDPMRVAQMSLLNWKRIWDAKPDGNTPEGVFMTTGNNGVHGADDVRLTEQIVAEDLQRQPHLLMMLAENALAVAESLRDNYFRNTARFIAALRQAAIRPDNPIMQ